MRSQQGTGSSYNVLSTVMMKTEVFWDSDNMQIGI